MRRLRPCAAAPPSMTSWQPPSTMLSRPQSALRPPLRFAAWLRAVPACAWSLLVPFLVLLLVVASAGTATAQTPIDHLRGALSAPPAAAKQDAAAASSSDDQTGDADETDAIADFLTPDPLGFDLSTFEAAGKGIRDGLSSVSGALDGFAHASLIEKLKQSAPLQLVFVFLLSFWFLDRRAHQLRRGLWDMVPPLSSPLFDNLLDSLLRVLARAAPVTVVLVPLYFPLKGLFPAEVWLVILTRCTWVLLIFRVVHMTVSELLVGELLQFEHKPVRLQSWAQLGLRVVLVLWILMEVVDHLDYDPSIVALIAFSTKVFLAVYALRLFTLRDELVQLFPSFPESPIYSVIRAGLTNYIHAVNGLSVLLVVLWAAGFATAAEFILVRTYALIGFVLLSLWVYRRVQRSLRDLIAQLESAGGDPVDPERHRVLRSLERSLMLVGSALLFWGVLNILGAWELLVRIASIRMFSPSETITISVFVLVKAFLILYVFVLASRVVRAVLYEKIYPRFEVDVGVGYAMNTTAHYTLIVTGTLLGLKSFGLDMSSVAIFFSALGLGIGFGLQDIVNNLISGFILLFGRSVKKGDYVTAGGTYGRVDSVGARSVTITTPDNYELVIPSSAIVSNSIINWTLSSPYVRVTIAAGISYNTDVPFAMEVLLETAKRHKRVMRRPRPEVWLEGFGDSSIDLGLLVYIDCRRTNERRVRGELNLLIWEALRESHIEIPFPQRDLHLRTTFDKKKVEDVVKAYLEERDRMLEALPSLPRGPAEDD